MFHVKHGISALERDFAQLYEHCGKASWVLPEKKWRKLWCHLVMVHSWSTKVGLVSASDRDFMATRHLLPALRMARFARCLPRSRVLDFGTGAGWPGIPLQIVLDDSQLILLESRRKRANFLKHVRRSLDLGDMRIVNERIEDVVPGCLGQVDLVVSRAVCSPDELWRQVRPHLAPHGQVATYLPSGQTNAMMSHRLLLTFRGDPKVGSADIAVVDAKPLPAGYSHLSTSY